MNDGSVTKTTNTFDKTGYCCKPLPAPADPNCVQNLDKGIECTLNAKDQGQPLYMSYWPGMTATACNSVSHNLVATSEKSTQSNSNLNLASRNAQVYEACY